MLGVSPYFLQRPWALGLRNLFEGGAVLGESLPKSLRRLQRVGFGAAAQMWILLRDGATGMV